MKGGWGDVRGLLRHWDKMRDEWKKSVTDACKMLRERLRQIPCSSDGRNRRMARLRRSHSFSPSRGIRTAGACGHSQHQQSRTGFGGIGEHRSGPGSLSGALDAQSLLPAQLLLLRNGRSSVQTAPAHLIAFFGRARDDGEGVARHRTWRAADSVVHQSHGAPVNPLPPNQPGILIPPC